MKPLFLLAALFPALALTTYTHADDTDTHSAAGLSLYSLYHGTAVHTTVDGTENQALVALRIEEMFRTDWRARKLFVYNVHMHGKHSVHAFIIERHPDTGFLKVYVPVDASVTETVETTSLANMNKFRESGWGNAYEYRGKHGYTKKNYHLNFVYTNGDRINHNITIKHYDNGSRKLFSHASAGTDADGLRYVWRDRMTMLRD